MISIEDVLKTNNKLQLIGINLEIDKMEAPKTRKSLGRDYMIYARILDINKEIKKLIIPDGVDVLIDGAYENRVSRRNIKEVVLPESLIEIDSHVFSNMENLRTINFPRRLEFIGNRALSNCKNLNIQSKWDNITGIGEFAFSTSGLTGKIEFGDRLMRLDEGAFYETYIVEIDLSKSKIKELGNGALAWCRKLEKASLPEELLVIGYRTFLYCDSLESVRIPRTLKRICSKAFEGCLKLRELDLSHTNIQDISEEAFDRCQRMKIILPKRVKNTGMKGLDTLDTLDNVTVEFR